MISKKVCNIKSTFLPAFSFTFMLLNVFRMFAVVDSTEAFESIEYLLVKAENIEADEFSVILGETCTFSFFLKKQIKLWVLRDGNKSFSILKYIIDKLTPGE